MKMWKFVAAAVLSTAALAPAVADAADLGIYPHRYHSARHSYGLPYKISYLHNYGPGAAPGTFAYWDGPSTNFCYQGSSAYIGQDRRRHPCF